MRRPVSLRPLELYGVSGRKGHGKDTFARLVREASSGSFLVDHFAGALKRMSAKLFGLTEAQMNDPVLKEAPFGVPIDMDLLLEAMRQETGLTEMQPAGKIAKSPREVMQFFGTEYVRRAQDDYWVQRLLGSVNGRRRVLVPDTRFPNEAKAIRDAGGLVIKILRVDAPAPNDEHPSETEIDKIEPDLLLGVRTGDLSLAHRVAALVAAGKFKAAQKYDYRTAQAAISAYLNGATLEDAALLLGHKRQKHPYALVNLLDYYGIEVRKRGGGRKSRVPHKVVEGVTNKWCSRCEAWKPLTDFNAASKSWDGLAGLCRPCASEANKARYQKYEKVDSLKAIFDAFKRNAQFRGRTFTLTVEDVQALWNHQSGRCHYSGVPMTTELKSPNKVSLDRQDPSLGYTKENVVLCAARVNLMKRDMTVSEFREVVCSLHNHMQSKQ